VRVTSGLSDGKVIAATSIRERLFQFQCDQWVSDQLLVILVGASIEAAESPTGLSSSALRDPVQIRHFF
jgi:hypothetical protein